MTERNTCNLCGGTRLRPLFRINSRRFYNSANGLRDEYTIAKCADCDLVFVLEIPSAEEMSDVYSDGYYSGRDQVGYKEYRTESRFDRAMKFIGGLPPRVVRTLKNPANIIEVMTRENLRPWPYNQLDKVRKFSSAGIILDVGCATGLFLLAARSEGWTARGVEFSAWSSQQARDAGLDVYTGTLDNAVAAEKIRPESVDVITLWDTAEHLRDPMATFRSAHTALRPGGLLFVETLNIDSDRSCAEGNRWHFFRPPKHLFFYSEKTLKAYFERSGFRIVKDDDFAHDVVTLTGQKVHRETNH